MGAGTGRISQPIEALLCPHLAVDGVEGVCGLGLEGRPVGFRVGGSGG